MKQESLNLEFENLISHTQFQFHIDEKITEIRGDGWYRYVIGQFNHESEAVKYIKDNLQTKGLPSPFPRILPDSLQRNETNEIVQINTGETDKKANIRDARANQDSVKRDVLPQTDPLTDNNNQPQERQKRLEKYNPWEELIGRNNLHKIELSIIDGAKPFLPASVLPFYIKMVDSAIRFPIILFFMMLIILFFLNALGIMIILEISNTLKNRTERYVGLYENMYERALTGYIFQEFGLETAVQRVKNINRKRNREIFVSVLF